ncbi:hypothetical protein [Methanobrevibacter sp.]|uniref:hypothetical protein n=1 Tax=Methanobrevibacter sp. TaxID=66852 RepID=UPI003863DA25
MGLFNRFKKKDEFEYPDIDQLKCKDFAKVYQDIQHDSRNADVNRRQKLQKYILDLLKAWESNCFIDANFQLAVVISFAHALPNPEIIEYMQRGKNSVPLDAFLYDWYKSMTKTVLVNFGRMEPQMIDEILGDGSIIPLLDYDFVLQK